MIWAVGIFIAIRVLLFLGPLSGLSYLHACMFCHIFLNLCIWKPWVYTSASSSNPAPQFILYIFNSFLWLWETCLLFNFFLLWSFSLKATSSHLSHMDAFFFFLGALTLYFGGALAPCRFSSPYSSFNFLGLTLILCGHAIPSCPSADWAFLSSDTLFWVIECVDGFLTALILLTPHSWAIPQMCTLSLLCLG